jgi:hypothetical protein
MPSLHRSPIWSDPRVKPKYGSVEINSAHPLSRGLATVCLANEGAGQLHDLVYNLRPNSSHGALTTPKWSTSAGGLAHTDTVAYFSTQPYLYNATSGSGLLILQDKTGVSDHLRLLGILDAQVINQRVWGWQVDNGFRVTDSFSLETSVGGSTIFYDFPNSTRQTGLHVYGLTINSGTDMRLFRDGSKLSTISIGSIDAGGVNSVPTVQSFVAADGIKTVLSVIWARALSDTEMIWATQEPYAFLMPVIRRRYFVPPAATGGKGSFFPFFVPGLLSTPS